MKPILKITAKTKNDIILNLEFKSIKQAKYFNKHLKDFQVVGYKEKQNLQRWLK
jgi:hypothetical protein